MAMAPHKRIVWLGYASVLLSIVWGVPSLLCTWYAHRLARGVNVTDQSTREIRRDVRGGLVLANIGATLGAIVLVVAIWSWF